MLGVECRGQGRASCTVETLQVHVFGGQMIKSILLTLWLRYIGLKKVAVSSHLGARWRYIQAAKQSVRVDGCVFWA